MSELLVKGRDVVVPGEVIARGMDFLPSHGTYRLGEEIRANMLGLVNCDGKVIKLIPLSGRYTPRKGDTIIGKVIDILMSGWRIDINTAISAVLPLQEASRDYIQKGADLSQYFDIDEYVVCSITNVTSQGLVDVSMKGQGLRKITQGRITKVTPYKVPRIIGKQGSMISMIKNATNSRITVGQNGLVWVFAENPEDEIKAVEAIQMVEENSHQEGLTDKISNFLGVDKNQINNNNGAQNEAPKQNEGDQ